MHILNFIEDAIDKIEESKVEKTASGITYYFEEIIKNINFYEALYNSLADEKSKEVLKWFIQFSTVYSICKIIDAKRLYPTELSDEEMRELKENVKNKPEYIIKDDELDAVEAWDLNLYTIPNIFILNEGDIVLDCGTYTGNTAIKFSKNIAEKGMVFGFEASPNTFSKFKNNIEKLNIQNITCHNYALYDKEGYMSFSGEDIGAKMIENGEIKVPTIDIDTFIYKNNIEKVDMIKFDIEGAELKAIKGAENTIKRFKPNLAVSAYHRPSDLVELPMFINHIEPNYDFYIRAESNNFNGFILFCVYNPDKNTCNLPFSENLYYSEKISNFVSDLHFNKKYLDIAAIKRIATIKKIKGQRDDYRIQRDEMKERMENFKSQRDDYKLQRDEVKEHMENFKSQRDDYKLQRDEVKEHMEKFKSQRDDYKCQRDEVKEYMEKFKSQRDDYKCQRDEVKEYMESFKSQRDDYKCQRDNYRLQIDKMKEHMEKFKSQRDDYKVQRDEVKKHMEEFKSQRNDYKTQRDEIKKHMEEFKVQRDNYKVERDEFKAQRDALELELNTKLYKKVLRKIRTKK